MTSTPTSQQLDDIETRANAATKAPWFATKDDTDTPVVFVNRTSPKGVTYSSVLWNADWATEADGEFTAHARTDVDVLLAEVRRLNAELARLEPAAIHARSALAALCYDLDDPGSDALGALYLIQQATVGVERPKDDAAAALARRDAEVMRRCAEFVRDTYSGEETADAADTLERDADVVERGCQSEAGTAGRLTNCPRCGRLSAKHPVPAGLAAAGSV
jgi:hypothetical protein